MPVEITREPEVATVATDPFHRLVLNNSPFNNLGSGGIFALPPEFNRKKFASAFVAEDEVATRQQQAPIEGSIYSAPGWAVWVYPNTIQVGVDEKGKPKEDKHSKAGQLHTVSCSNKVKYVLMYRDAEIQQQVSEIQGLVSRERMDVAIETGAVPGADSSILGNDRLPRDLLQEAQQREDAEMRGGPVASSFQGKQVTKQSIRVSR